ncbi:MAG: hypothetical protein IPK82_39595 [Polyangiaceae bacterium]|nr:hypothetical protein [Polyangiaceae bacterium]
MRRGPYRRLCTLRAAAVFVALMCTHLSPRSARADLKADADRLAQAWSAKKGVTVRRLSPLFLEHGRAFQVNLAEGEPKAVAPTAPSSSAPAASAKSTAPATSAAPAKSSAPSAPSGSTNTAPPNAVKETGCMTVVFLAPRTSEFAVLSHPANIAAPASLPLDHPALANDASTPLKAQAGVATLSRCGKEQRERPLENERALAQSISQRTAVEVLVVRSTSPLDAVDTILVDRAVGPVAPRGDTGRPLDPGPLTDRINRVEKRAKDGGTSRIVKVPMRASNTGTGTFALRLSEGCHAVDLLADVPPNAIRGTDVDGDVRVAETGRMLARDRGEAPDGHMEFCLGETTNVEVGFLGASGPVEVTLVDANWPLAESIPAEWGPDARGDIAFALRRRHTPALPSHPIATFVGVQGETVVPFTVEPGQCYIAVTAYMRGQSRSLRLSVEIGDRAPRDEVAERAEAAQVAFCAKTEDRAKLRVLTRGEQPWWTALIWRVSQ